MKKILIVEDIDLNLDLILQLLEDDYICHIARDGIQAIEMTNTLLPDLVLMDISLPLLDGYQATQAIRQAGSTMPIIGLSAHAMQGDRDKALQAGCTDYLTKPVDEALLTACLNKYLE
jgi:CheY-like chemotaxis protein